MLCDLFMRHVHIHIAQLLNHAFRIILVTE